MKVLVGQMWKEDDAVLAFEWVLLATLLTIGIVGGVAAARDAIIDELGDVAQAMLSVDQSYSINFPLAVNVHTINNSGGSDTSFRDIILFSDCGRVDASSIPDQGLVVDSPGP